MRYKLEEIIRRIRLRLFGTRFKQGQKVVLYLEPDKEPATLFAFRGLNWHASPSGGRDVLEETWVAEYKINNGQQVLNIVAVGHWWILK